MSLCGYFPGRLLYYLITASDSHLLSLETVPLVSVALRLNYSRGVTDRFDGFRAAAAS